MTGRERVAKIIREALTKSKLTDSEVAKRAGLERTNLCRLARGHHDPKMSTIFRIIEACGFEFVEIRTRRIALNSTDKQIVDKAKAKA